MKSSQPQRRSRPLRAKASAMNPSEFEDAGLEPNMKLSHAFMVVLALHIIAVGGLFAFNKLKMHHVSFSSKPKSQQLVGNQSAATLAVENHQPSGATQSSNTGISGSLASSTPVVSTSTPGTLTTTASPSQVAAEATKTLPPSPSSSTAPLVTPTPEDSSNSSPALREYTILKGDNPYKVARKFHVSYEELIKLNNITDPRKIQIGQKLKIPAIFKQTAKHSTLKK